MNDCLLDMLEDLRAQGREVPLWDADRREGWFDALAQLIVELRTEDQRMAWVALVTNDLCQRVLCLSFSVGAALLLDRMRVLREMPR